MGDCISSIILQIVMLKSLGKFTRGYNTQKYFLGYMAIHCCKRHRQ
jgi:hypothetical protein